MKGDRHNSGAGGIPRPGRTAASTRSRAFTLIELLVVIAIIALLAALIAGLATYATKRNRESRIRAELNQLQTAIEAYHAAFGQYPPDNVVSRNPVQVNPALHSLFYELTGTLVNNAQGTFRTPERAESQGIGAAQIESLFGVKGIVNAKRVASELRKPFAVLKEAQHKAIRTGPDVEVLVVPVPWPANRTDQPIPDSVIKGVNPWRYVSTGPTNNPNSFDLWAEYVDGNKIKIIGNWSPDTLDKP